MTEKEQDKICKKRIMEEKFSSMLDVDGLAETIAASNYVGQSHIVTEIDKVASR